MTQAAEHRFRIGPLLAATIATVLLLWLFGRIADLLLLLFVAALLALFLGSLTDGIVHRLRLPRPVAFTIALVAMLGSIYGLVALLVPPIVQQTRQLIGVMPQYIGAWQDAIAHLLARYPAIRETLPEPGDVVGSIVKQAEGAAAGVVPKVVSLGHQVVNLVSILVMGIYLALYPSLYREWLIALFPPVHRDTVRDVLADMGSTLRAWIVGQLIAMSVLALLTSIGLWILGVPSWLTFGVFTGVVVIVPFFGTLIGTLLPALFVLGGSGFAGLGPGGHFLLVVLLGVLLHIIEGNIVVPLITAKRVELPPVLSMMAVLIAGRLLGLGGIIVAVPLAAVVMVMVRRILIHRVYEGQSFQRTARDRVLVLRVPAADGTVLQSAASPVDVLRAVT